MTEPSTTIYNKSKKTFLGRKIQLLEPHSRKNKKEAFPTEILDDEMR